MLCVFTGGYWQLQERHAATSGAAPVSPDEGFEQFLCREVGRTLSGGSVTSEHRATFEVGPGAAMHSFAEEALHAILTMANQSEASAPRVFSLYVFLEGLQMDFALAHIL